MNNNISVNFNFINNNFVNNNNIWHENDTTRYTKPPIDLVNTRIVAVLSTDSEKMAGFKNYMAGKFPDGVTRTLGKPSMQSQACAVCDVWSSKEWRSGPDNQQVCNACGIQFGRFKKAMLQAEQERTREKMSLSYILN